MLTKGQPVLALSLWLQTPSKVVYQFYVTGITYLCPSLPVEHRPSTTPRHRTLFRSALARPVGPLLFQLCFSVSPPTVARPASLSLLRRVPGQGWLPEGVSDPAPLPPQYLLGHWYDDLKRQPENSGNQPQACSSRGMMSKLLATKAVSAGTICVRPDKH